MKPEYLKIFTKTCSKCGEIKSVNEFPHDKTRRDGFSYWCKVCTNEIHRLYWANNLDKVRKTKRFWYKNNPEKSKIRTQRWRANNFDKVRMIGRKSSAKQRSTPEGKLNCSISAAIYRGLRNNKAGKYWGTQVNFTLTQLQKYLEKQFQPGMTWNNYGVEWHVDHIIPVSVFNFEKPEDLDFKRCWALKNLQPLWAKDNRKKQNKISNSFQPSLIF